MNAVVPLRDFVENICARGRISSQDVLAMRRQVFPDGIVDDDEAAAMFRLDQACEGKDPDWARFYVDALTDYFVWQSAPRGYVSTAQAAHLIGEITRDGYINTTRELELLINVIHWSVQCPEQLALLALKAVKESVLTPHEASYGSNRQPGVITEEDVALIRKVIYASASPGGFTVTRQEAELLIALDRASLGEENAASWPDLLAKGVANAVMFPRGAPVVPGADEAFRREKWLDERPQIGALLMNTGQAMARGNIAFDAVFGSREAREERAREELRLREALRREAIDGEEARWLLKMFGQSGPLSTGAIALLKFIKANSPQIDPAFDPLFVKAGL